MKFHAKYKDKGVAFVAISPNDPKAVRLDELGYSDLDDSFEAMKIRAKDHHYPYPYLYDGETQATAARLRRPRDPAHLHLRRRPQPPLQGRLDDAEVKPVKSHDAINAVDALLAGRDVPVETTRVTAARRSGPRSGRTPRPRSPSGTPSPSRSSPIDEAGVAKLVKNETDRLLVVNLWATWCGPCVAELDELVTMNRMFRGRKFRMVTISLDEPKKTRRGPPRPGTSTTPRRRTTSRRRTETGSPRPSTRNGRGRSRIRW